MFFLVTQIHRQILNEIALGHTSDLVDLTLAALERIRKRCGASV